VNRTRPPAARPGLAGAGQRPRLAWRPWPAAAAPPGPGLAVVFESRVFDGDRHEARLTPGPGPAGRRCSANRPLAGRPGALPLGLSATVPGPPGGRLSAPDPGSNKSKRKLKTLNFIPKQL
jgi:hypothetical protein